MNDLTPRQLQVLEDMFLNALGFRAACEKYSISTATLAKWKKSPAWIQEWNERMEERRAKFRAMITAAAPLAAKTYIDCMKDENAAYKDKLHAADSVAKLADFEPAQKTEISGTLTTQTPDMAAIIAERAALAAEKAALLAQLQEQD